MSINSRVIQINNLLHFFKGLLTKLIYQRGAEGFPVVLSKIEDSVTECRRIGYVECCLRNMIVGLFI